MRLKARWLQMVWCFNRIYAAKRFFWMWGGGSLFINSFNTVRMAKLGKLGMAWYWFIVHRLVYPQDDNAALAPSEPLVA